MKRLLTEADFLEKKWEQTRYLDGVTDSYKRKALSVLLENQRLINDAAVSSPIDGPTKEKLIDLTYCVFSNLLIWNLVIVQPLLGPAGLVYKKRRSLDIASDGIMDIRSQFQEDSNLSSEDIAVRTNKLKRVISDDFGPKDVALSVINEIDGEVLQDLWNNCNTLSYFPVVVNETVEDTCKRLKEAIGTAFGLMMSKCEMPNWAVVNSFLYMKYRNVFDSLHIKIYLHDNVENGVLFGYKGEDFDAGYAYVSYIPFTLTPSYKHLYCNLTVNRLLTRYGKKLFNNGACYYHRMTFQELKKGSES